MLKIVTTLLLLILSSIGYADDNGLNVAGFFTIASQDQSYAMLGQVFGPVGNVLHPQGKFTPHTLGAMFRSFNIVMLALNILVISYTTIFGLINTANEGEFLGKKLNSAWLPIRSVLGIALLIPTKSGYCMLQVLMMWVVLQGIGAADHVWGVVLNTPVPVPAAHKAGNKKNSLNSTSGSASQVKLKIATFMPKIIEESTCKNYYELLSSKPSSGQGGSGSGKKSFQLNTQECNMVNKPDQITVPDKSDGAKDYFSKKALKEAFQDIEVGQKHGALDSVGHALAVCYKEGKTVKECLKGSGDTQIFKDLAQPFVTRTNNEREAYLDYLDHKDDHNDESAAGWAYAGAYYHSIYTKAKHLADVMPKPGAKEPVTSSVSKDVLDSPKSNESFKAFLDNVNDEVGQKMHEQGHYPHMSTIKGSQISHYSGLSTSVFDAYANAFIRVFVQMLVGNERFFMSQHHAIIGNPITHLQIVGTQAIQIVEILGSWLFPVLLTIIVYFNMSGSNQPMWGVAMSLSAVLFSGFLVVGGMLMTFGLLTSVYVPLIPYIIFYFGVLGWIMAVIETMLAAPMVAMGIASPDGQHELLGRAEPAVMLVTGVFVRPTLMIFGLVAGFLLSLVGMQFLNNTYYYIVSKSLAGSNINDVNPAGPASKTGGQSQQYMGPFQWVGYIVVYISIVLQLINKSYGLIHQIPDQVLRWIGGQSQFGEYARGEEEVQQKQSQGMQQVGQVGAGMGAVASKGGMSGAKAQSQATGGGGSSSSDRQQQGAQAVNRVSGGGGSGGGSSGGGSSE